MKIKRLLFLFCPLFFSACASQSDLTVVADDVKKLRSESESTKSLSASSYSDMQQVRDEIAQLKGLIDEDRYKNKQTFGRLSLEDSLLVQKMDNIENRLQRLERQAGIVSHKSSGSESFSASSGVAQSDRALLDDGVQNLAKKSFAAARENFAALIATYPKSDLVDDAQFYIAESYFSEKWYEKAVLEYQTVIARYTKSNRRPTALYKQALAFEQLGDRVNAKARFRDVMSVYPSSPEAALARKKLQ